MSSSTGNSSRSRSSSPVAAWYGADGFEVPECGIDRVVLRPFALVGEAIGQHALVHKASVGAQDARCDLGPAGGQRQAGQADHRVAAPIGEPGVAGDHALALRITWQRPVHDELIGCQDQLLVPGRRRGRAAAHNELLLIGLSFGVGGRAVQVRIRLGAGHQRHRVARLQRCGKLAGTQVIVQWIQSPVGFDAQIVVPVPFGLGRDLGLAGSMRRTALRLEKQ